MKRISIIGHFGFGGNYLDGQTIKTKIVAEEMKKSFGSENVSCHDTHGGIKFVMRLPWVVFNSLLQSRNVIILPAYKGVLAITPLLVLLNICFRRSLHYAVVGGWLPDYVNKYSFLKASLKTFEGIYVETTSMKRKLEEAGLRNVILMTNCKEFSEADFEPSQASMTDPYRVCTFSRVMKEKGIEDAISIVKLCNERLGYKGFTLDVYGQVWPAQQEWFDNLFANQPDFIKYKGCVEFSNSINVLKNYFALLFPTYYYGEGVAGTFIDAFAAGLPVLTTDWHDNSEIIEDGKTGYVLPVHGIQEFADKLIALTTDKKIYQVMCRNCRDKIKDYLPENALKPLIQRLG